MKYDVILIEDKLKDLFPNNPFSLKNDLKKIGIELKEKIIQEVVYQIVMGFNRKECVKLDYKIDNDKKIFIILAKIRIKLENERKKVSLRCISLVDKTNMLCIILHIYAKNKKEDLSSNELKLAKNILSYYYNEIIRENENE